VNRRTYIRVLLWLLPLLFARAFIPTGFMLGEGPDGFGLVFCSGTMPMSPASNSSGPHQPHQHPDHSTHAGHNHYEADAKAGSGADSGPVVAQSGHSHSHGDSDSAACPFAIGACAAFIDIPYLASLPALAIDEQVQPGVLPTSGVATPRAHPIRGPPQSS
jgi:hypothetical protein